MENENIDLGKITSQATAEAFEKARLTNIPVIIKVNNQLIELFPNGDKKVLKNIVKKNKSKSNRFIIT